MTFKGKLNSKSMKDVRGDTTWELYRIEYTMYWAKRFKQR